MPRTMARNIDRSAASCRSRAAERTGSTDLARGMSGMVTTTSRVPLTAVTHGRGRRRVSGARARLDEPIWVRGPRRSDPYVAFDGVGRVGPATAERQRAAGSLWLSRSGEVELLGGLSCSSDIRAHGVHADLTCPLTPVRTRPGPLGMARLGSSW